MRAGEVFRSVLCLWQAGRDGTRLAAGPAAIEAYLEDPLASRLIMSMKSYLAQRSFRETRIHGRAWTLEALVAAFLGELLAPSGAALAGARVVVGRPVRFAGETADDAYGEERLRAAFAAAGLPRRHGGAGTRGRRLPLRQHAERAGDGAGRRLRRRHQRFLGAAVRAGAAAPGDALGHAGVGIAGDALDYRIIDRVVSPLLGKGDQYTVWGKPMPIPAGWFTGFARWHQLSLMRAPKILADIAEVTRTAEHPDRLRHLVMLVEEEAGYALYRAVSGVKAALSRRRQRGAALPARGFRGRGADRPRRFRGLDRPRPGPHGRRGGCGAGRCRAAAAERSTGCS